jgi:hypothetical protein
VGGPGLLPGTGQAQILITLPTPTAFASRVPKQKSTPALPSSSPAPSPPSLERWAEIAVEEEQEEAKYVGEVVGNNGGGGLEVSVVLLGRKLLETLKEVEELFAHAAEAGKEVSGMLEAAARVPELKGPAFIPLPQLLLAQFLFPPLQPDQSLPHCTGRCPAGETSLEFSLDPASRSTAGGRG